MNFIERILAAGFVEQGMKRVFDVNPKRIDEKQRWWEHYNWKHEFWGVDMYHPDAWFMKDGFDGKLLISLGGLSPGTCYIYDDGSEWAKNYNLQTDAINKLFKEDAVRYISLKQHMAYEDVIKSFPHYPKVYYETYTGIIPPDEIVDQFIKDNS